MNKNIRENSPLAGSPSLYPTDEAMFGGADVIAEDEPTGHDAYADVLDTGETLSLYFKDIKDSKPLTKDEEISLATELENQWNLIRRCLARFPLVLNTLRQNGENLGTGDVNIDAILDLCHTTKRHIKDSREEQFRDTMRAIEDHYRPLLVASTSRCFGQATLATISGGLEAMEAIQDHVLQLELRREFVEELILKVVQAWRGMQGDKSLTAEEAEDYAAILNAIQGHREYIQALKDQFVTANLRLVIHLGKKYVNRGLALSDLLQEGNIGLMHAVDKFDARKGFRFSTYATWWIKQSITRALFDFGRPIRIPIHMNELIVKYYRGLSLLRQNNNHEPTVEDIAMAMDVDVETADMVIRMLQNPTSLDTPLKESEGSSLGDFIPDQRWNPYDFVSDANLRETLTKMVNRLDDRERLILRLRFGLDNEAEHTLEELGKRLGLTRERVRQLEVRALKKLRAKEVTSDLHDMALELH